MKSTFEINDLFKIIWKHIWVVILAIIVCIGGVFLLSKAPAEADYETNTEILVFPTRQNNINYATMQDMLLSKAVLGKAIKQYEPTNNEKKPTFDELTKTVVPANTGGSQVISFSTTDSNKTNALRLARSIAKVYMKQVKAQLPVHSVSMITKPTVSTKAAPSLSKKKTIVFGGGAGLFLGLILAFVIEATQRLRAAKKKH
jgi:capsular polysaccharide biosynthesis protein